ncbi:hypothetical protein HBH79_249800 [Parastagonospora nodorum]|nr:hypothetical protein HBH79_249800 [Parastagonospora nodorum]
MHLVHLPTDLHQAGVDFCSILLQSTHTNMSPYTNIRYMYAGRELESRSAMSDSCSEYVAMHSHSRWI